MEKITQKKKYFVVRERAVPEVLLKVVQAKKLLDSEKVSTVQEQQSRPGSVEAPFINIRMIFFRFMKKREERRSPLSFRWMMSREFCL